MGTHTDRVVAGSSCSYREVRLRRPAAALGSESLLSHGSVEVGQAPSCFKLSKSANWGGLEADTKIS
jgi:hypothetical protein